MYQIEAQYCRMKKSKQRPLFFQTRPAIIVKNTNNNIAAVATALVGSIIALNCATGPLKNILDIKDTIVPIEYKIAKAVTFPVHKLTVPPIDKMAPIPNVNRKPCMRVDQSNEVQRALDSSDWTPRESPTIWAVSEVEASEK